MTRLRSSLLLLALAALLSAGVPATAETAEPARPEVVAGHADTWLDTLDCPAATAPESVIPDLGALPLGDFILCNCKLCEDYPDVICQISPMGYSILCADWYRTHC